MNIKQLLVAAGIGIAGIVGISSTAYTVNEGQQAVVTRLGKPVRMIVHSYGGVSEEQKKRIEEWNTQQESPVKVESGAGLYFKVPLFDSVTSMESRILEYDAAPKNIVTRNKQKLTVDTFAPWRIDNPLLFSQRVGTEKGAQLRLDDTIYSGVREEAGKYDLIEIVRNSNEPIKGDEEKGGETKVWENIQYGREKILATAAEDSRVQSFPYGIDVLDVRIKMADLPPENAASVYNRMNAERKRISDQFLAEGKEQDMMIRSGADKEAAEIESGALKQAGETKGEADRRVVEIYANAASQDPNFFRLWRTLQAYDKAFGPDSTVVVGESPFTRYLLGTSGK